MEDEREQAIHFFEDDEIKCVALMEQLLQSAENIYILEKSEIKSENNSEKNDFFENKCFCALFFIKNKSTLFHYIPESTLNIIKNEEIENIENQNLKKNKIKNIISDFINNLNLFCIYGNSDGTKYLEKLINQKIIKINDYFLMLHNKEKIAEIEKNTEKTEKNKKIKNNSKIINNLNIKKCTINDVDLLLELERGYRKEEVQITEHDENDAIIKYILNNSLNNQIIYSLIENRIVSENAIAKAGTNACGKEYFQIGGVYCKKEYRGKGNCFAVMFHLIKNIYELNKKPVLFVKETNERAKHLYEQLGFYQTGNFRISYFQRG